MRVSSVYVYVFFSQSDGGTLKHCAVVKTTQKEEEEIRCEEGPLEENTTRHERRESERSVKEVRGEG